MPVTYPPKILPASELRITLRTYSHLSPIWLLFCKAWEAE